MSISPEINKQLINSSIYPLYLEAGQESTHQPEVVEESKEIVPIFVDRSELPEDRLLNYLILRGIIDEEWRLTPKYRGITLEDMKIDANDFEQLLQTTIFPNKKNNDFSFDFFELLQFIREAAETPRELKIHGSYVLHLIGVKLLKDKLSSHFPEIEEYLEPLHPQFNFSDLDLKVVADQPISNFTDRLVKLMTKKFVSTLKYEISEFVDRYPSVNVFTFDEFLKYLNKLPGIYTITTIRIFRGNSPVEIENYSIDQHLKEINVLKNLSDDPEKVRDLLVDRFVNRDVYFEFARPVFFPHPNNKDMLAEGETVKMPGAETDIDLFYKRKGVAEDSRVEYQKISIALLPDNSHRVEGTFQGVIDSICGIGHWTKQDIDEDDLGAYLFMVTRGLRFPRHETLNQEKSNPTNYNKLIPCSNDFKAVFLLNTCQALGLQQFSAVIPDSRVLKTLFECLTKGGMSLKTAQAVLTFVGYRAHLMPKNEREHLPYRVNLTQNEGQEVFRFNFGGAFFCVQVDMKHAWDEICAYANSGEEQQSYLISLIRSLGGIRSIVFGQDAQIQPDLTVKDLMASYGLGNPILRRMVAFLLFSRIGMNSDIEAIGPLLSRFYKFRKEEYLLDLLKGCRNKFHKPDREVYDNCLQILFKKDFSSPTEYVPLLLTFENELFFKIGLELLEKNLIGFDSKTCFCMAKDQILRNRAGKAMGILEILAKNQRGFESDWSPLLNEIISLLNRLVIRPEDIATWQMRIIRLLRTLILVFNYTKVQKDFIKDWETLNALLSHVQHDDISIKFKKCVKDIETRTSEVRLQELVSAMKDNPTVEKALILLDFASSCPELVRGCFIHFMKHQFDGQQLSCSLPILLTLFKNDVFKGLFSKIGPHTKLMELLRPILKRLFASNEYFEAIGTLLSLDYNHSRADWLHFLKMAAQLPATAEKEMQFNAIRQRLKASSPTPEDKVELVLVETSFKMTSIKDKNHVDAFVSALNDVGSAQQQYFLFEFCKLLWKFTQTENSLKNTFEAIRTMRGLMNLGFFVKAELLKIREFDNYIIGLIFDSYEPQYHDFAFFYVTQLLELKQGTKKDLDSLKSHINKSIKNFFDLNDDLKKFLNDLFDHLCNRMPHNANCMGVLDTWIGADPTNAFVGQMITRMTHLDPLVHKKLPSRLLHYIKTVLEARKSRQDLRNVSKIVTQPSFSRFVDKDTYKNTMRCHFSIVSQLLLALDGPFKTVVQGIWDFFIKDLSPYFVIRSSMGPIPEVFEKTLKNLAQKYPIEASARGLARSMLFECYDIFLKLHSPTEGSFSIIEKLLSQPFEDIQDMDSMIFLNQTTKEMDPQILLLLLESVVLAKPTETALAIAKNAFVIHLINRVKNLSDPEFLRIFDLFIYQNQSHLDVLGMECYFYPVRYWLERFVTKGILNTLPRNERLEREIAYKGFIISPEERLFQYDNVSRILFRAVERLRDNGICYHSRFTKTLFETIHGHVHVHHNLLYMLELERLLRSPPSGRLLPEYYYEICVNLINAAQNFLISIKNGTIKFESGKEREYIEELYSTVKDVIPRLEYNSIYIFSLRSKLAVLLRMLPDKLEDLINKNDICLHDHLEITTSAFLEEYNSKEDDLHQKFKVSGEYCKMLKRYMISLDETKLPDLKAFLIDEILLLWSSIFMAFIDLASQLQEQELRHITIINACSAVAFCLRHNYFDGNNEIYFDSVDGILCLLSDFLKDTRSITPHNGKFADALFEMTIKKPYHIYMNEGNLHAKKIIIKTLDIIYKNHPEMYIAFTSEIFIHYDTLLDVIRR